MRPIRLLLCWLRIQHRLREIQVPLEGGERGRVSEIIRGSRVKNGMVSRHVCRDCERTFTLFESSHCAWIVKRS